MKKILALLIGIYPFASYSAGLPIDFSKEGKYSSATWNVVTYMFHPSLLDDRDEALKAYRYVVKIFSEVERVIPKTVSHFKKQNIVSPLKFYPVQKRREYFLVRSKIF